LPTDRQHLQANGYSVDTSVYPWFAYKGPRFAPTANRRCRTDLECEQIEQIARLTEHVETLRQLRAFDQQSISHWRDAAAKAEQRVSDMSWTPGSYQNGA
jgi:hypothetical protein